MMPVVLERLVTQARMIFDLEDRYAADRRLRDPRPRPIEPLRFWLVGTVNAAGPQTFAHPDEMIVIRNSGGYHLFFDQVIPYGSTLPVKRSFAEGTYIVRITSEVGPVRRGMQSEQNVIYSQVYQWVQMENVALKALPGGVAMERPYSLALEPGYAYPFPASIPLGTLQPGDCNPPTSGGQRGPTLLRGALHGLDGKGIVGATVSAPGAQSTYQVDSDGQWVLVFDDAQPTNPLTVKVTVPGKTPVDLDNVCVIHGCETSLPETALRGWVLRKGIGVNGAKVRVAGLGQQITVETRGDGQWIVYLQPGQGMANVTVTAMLPDGSNPKVQNVSIQPRSTVLVPTFLYS